MADKVAHPPRKKSRFFSNGKMKIESWLKSKEDRNDRKDENLVEGTESDESSTEDTDEGSKYVSAARAVKFTPIGRGISVELPNRFGPSAHVSTPEGSNSSNLSTTSFPDHNVQAEVPKQSRSLAAHSHRRAGIYGTYNEGTPILRPLPPVSNIAVVSDTNPTSNPYQNHLDFRQHALVPEQAIHVRSQTPLQPRLSITEYGFETAPIYQQGTPNSRTKLQQGPTPRRLLNESASISGDPYIPKRSEYLSPFNGSQHAVPRNTFNHSAVLPNRSSKPQTSTLRQQQTQEYLHGDRTSVHSVENGLDSRNSERFDPNHSKQTLPSRSRRYAIHLPHTPLFGQNTNIPSLDLDRDATGALLPPHLRSFVTQPPIGPLQKRTNRDFAISMLNPKRKRVGPNFPPPAYVYVRSNDPGFNVFSNGFLFYPELCFTLAAQMPLRDLMSLYAISKDFHTIIDSRFTTTCLTQALQKAPQSAKVFQFRSYAEHCRNDPAARIPHPDPKKAALQIPRKIPSFRWVSFVLHREKVVHEIMTLFAERGCPLPARCALALKKIWLLMDIPDNARRIAIIHNHRIYTDMDLYFLTCFIVKLDMIANDPMGSEKRDGLRKLLLAQRGGLMVILKVLKREMWQKESDFVVAWVRTMMTLEILTKQQLDDMGVQSILGVPRDEVGIGKFEYWGQKGIQDEVTGQRRSYLLRPDQLVMREALRRGLRFTEHYLRCVLYGYIRPDTLEDYAPRTYGRRIKGLQNEDYGINDSVGGGRAWSIEDGGDSLLDLGDTHRGSKWTIQKEIPVDQERVMRKTQTDLLENLYQVSEAEQREEVGHGMF